MGARSRGTLSAVDNRWTIQNVHHSTGFNDNSSLDIKWSHDFTLVSMPNFHFFGGAEFAGKVADLA